MYVCMYVCVYVCRYVSIRQCTTSVCRASGFGFQILSCTHALIHTHSVQLLLGTGIWKMCWQRSDLLDKVLHGDTELQSLYRTDWYTRSAQHNSQHLSFYSCEAACSWCETVSAMNIHTDILWLRTPRSVVTATTFRSDILPPSSG